MTDQAVLLRHTADLAADFLAGLDARPVGPPVDSDDLRTALGGPLPQNGSDAALVIDRLVAAVDPGLVATAGPRYFGFVIGGSQPAALATDWLVSAWDQNAAFNVMSPAAAAIEDIVERWFVELVGLPEDTGVGFTTGATLATFAALATARQEVLLGAGWDVDRHGLIGAPPVRVIVGDEVHTSVTYALRLLGFGDETAIRVAADGQGRMRPDALAETLGQGSGPTIVCAQSGNVNSGAFDPLEPIVAACRQAGAWLHVDGAFGLWAAASPALRRHVAGIEGADSWATDAHKWLNVPYDCGIVAVADRQALRRSMVISAAYLAQAGAGARDGHEYTPESSRRARAIPVYAALRALGRTGLAELVDRCCELARRMADRLAAADDVEILNDVVLNQVLVRFPAVGGGAAAADERTRAVIAAVQADGTCWLGGTTWHGLAAMRISVSGWNTTEDDIDRSADAILRCARAVGTAPVAPA